jgi:hypothetical protein
LGTDVVLVPAAMLSSCAFGVAFAASKTVEFGQYHKTNQKNELMGVVLLLFSFHAKFYTCSIWKYSEKERESTAVIITAVTG